MINFNRSLKKGGYALIQFAIEKKSLRKQLFELFYLTAYKVNNVFGFLGKGFDVTVTRYFEEELMDIIQRAGFVVEKRDGSLFLLKKVSET
ncbi:MAG: hypothetical protein KKE05_03115 [Nanoarchaeota archaeon]|nr:hypothetical protein [Nanoarchaeota archaeon]